MIVQHRARRSGIGAIVVGLILIFIGGYYVLRNTLGMNLPELDSDQVVPVIAVLIGAAIIVRAWSDRIEETRTA